MELTKFGSMFLAQVPTTPGMVVAAIADLDVEAARAAFVRVGWDADRIAAVRFLEDGATLARADGIDVVIEATANTACRWTEPGATLRCTSPSI